MTEMEVVGVALEPNSNRPLVWLKDKDQRVFLPIAIGNFEATAIYMALYNEPPPRPITYDLLQSILEGLDAQVDHVLINALEEDIFFAEISLSSGEQTIEVDARPSDAIAVALRVGAPLYVKESVIQEAGLDVEDELDPSLEDLETGVERIGDVEEVEVARALESPAEGVPERVVNLKAKLQEAVAQEEYEEAAKLRDEIGRIEHESIDR